MAVKATITLQGGKALEKKLKELPKGIRNKVIRQSLRAGAKIVHTETKAQAPVKSGLLKSALKVRAAKRSRSRIGVNVQTKDGDYKGETFYGAFVEYGHRLGKRTNSIKRAQKKGVAVADGRRFIEGKHFMRNAFDAKAPEAARVIEQSLKAGVEREASA